MLAVTSSWCGELRRDEWLWVPREKAFLGISCVALGKSLNSSGPQLPSLENGLLITTSEVTERTSRASLWDGPIFSYVSFPPGGRTAPSPHGSSSCPGRGPSCFYSYTIRLISTEHLLCEQ